MIPDDMQDLKVPVCNDRVCLYGNITPEDIKIVEIGFNILIFLSYMEFYFPDVP